MGFAVMMVAAVGVFTGCQTYGPSATPMQIDRYAEQAYPANAELGNDYDIAVTQSGGKIQVINREPRAYRDYQLWLNRQYVRDVPVLDAGPNNRFDLTGFINQYREPVPVGTPLAPDKTVRIVLAELYDPRTDRRHRLTVWPEARDGLKLLPW